MIDPQPTLIQYNNTLTCFACTHISAHTCTHLHTKRTIPIQSPCEWVVVSREHAMGTYTTFQPTTWPRHSVSSHSSYSCPQSSIPVYYMGSRAQWTRILLCSMLVTNCFVAPVSQHILHCTYACIDGQITHVGILEYMCTV